MAGKSQSFTDRVRQLVLDSGRSQADIRHATGIDRATLSRFVNGERFLSPKALNKIAEYLGWDIHVKKNKG